MEASLRRENTRIRDRLAALRCRGGEDAVLFGVAPPDVPFPESAPAKPKYQPTSQLTTASASATHFPIMKGGAKAPSNLSEDLMEAIENLIRTILEDKDQRVSKANCYRALQKYASAQLEIRQVRVQLIRLQREATPGDGEKQIVKLGEFLKDLQIIHKEQSRTFREAIEAKDAQLYYQEEKLKASKTQIKELESQLQALRERSTEYEKEIRCLNAALMGGEQQATAPSTLLVESQEDKDLKIRELQAQLDALMSVRSGELDEDEGEVTPRQSSLSDVSMGDYCDFLEPSVAQEGALKTKHSATAAARKDSKPAEEGCNMAGGPRGTKPPATVQQESSQSLDVLGNVGAPNADSLNCLTQKEASKPVAIRSILRKPKHSAPIEPPQTARVDAKDADPSQDMQVGSSNVSLDLLVALDKGGGGGPRSNSPVVKSKSAIQRQSAQPPVPAHPTIAGGSSDASIDLLAGTSASTQTTPVRTASSTTSSGTAVGSHTSEGSLNDFDLGGGGNEDAVKAHSVLAQTRTRGSASPTSGLNQKEEPNNSSSSMSESNRFAESEKSLEDGPFGEKSGGTDMKRQDDGGEEEKKDSDESSSICTEPDNQKGFDESEASLADELFPADDSSSEGVTMHHDDAGFVTQSKVGVQKCERPSEQTQCKEGGSEDGSESAEARTQKVNSEDANDSLSIVSPEPDNQRGFDTSEASLREELFLKEDEGRNSNHERQRNAGEAVPVVPPPSTRSSRNDEQTANRTGEDDLTSSERSESKALEAHTDDVLSVASPMPDNQKGFDESESSLEDELFEGQVDDESQGSGTHDEDGERKELNGSSSSAAVSVPDNQKGFDSSEPSLNEELFLLQDDGSVHSIQSNGKAAPVADDPLEASLSPPSDVGTPNGKNCADETGHNCHVDGDGSDGDDTSTCTPEPDNQKGYDASEGSLNDIFEVENDAELDVIEEDDEASSIASEPEKRDTTPVRTADQLQDDEASTATPVPDNQQGYEATEGSMTDELFVEDQADEQSISEAAAAGDPRAHAPTSEAGNPEGVSPQSPVKEGIIFVQGDDPQSPDFRDLTVDGSTIGDVDEGQDESSTIDSVTGVSYLHGSEELTEQLIKEACQIEERSAKVSRDDAPAEPEPPTVPKGVDALVSSPASRAERVIPHGLKRQDTVSSTFGVDSLRFLSAGSLQGDESQRSATKQSSRHSKFYDESRLNRSTSDSRSRPPLSSIPPVKESKPSNNEQVSDIDKALELSASRARSIELSRKVEQVTLQLEQERVVFSNEKSALQAELQGTKAALEKCKGTVASLEKELSETEYKLVQAKHKVSMLETYVVEDLVPPDDVVDACYASKGRVRPSPSDRVDDASEVKLLKKEAADLRSQLTVANTLVIKLEDDRSRQMKKIADLTELLQASKDSKKRLFEKSVECADLASERDLIQVQLTNLREKNASLEVKLSETLEELEDLRISAASKSVRDFAIPAEHLEERERTLTRVMETSIELAECKMKLDTVTEQLKAEQKKNQELAASITDLDRSSSVGGLRTRVGMPLSQSNHSPSPSQRGGRHLLGLSSGILSNSYHGNTTARNDAADVQRLQRTIAELEQQNEAYRLQVASLKQKNRMGTVQE